MNNILKNMGVLYNQELYSNVVKLAELAITACDQSPDRLTPAQKFRLLVYYADSLFYLEEYFAAERNYNQALQTRKYMLKIKSSSNKNAEEKDLVNETDIKYKIYQCLMKLRQDKKAAEVLETIPARNRTVKVNMALGNYYKNNGKDRAAITCFKETLKECPLALETAEYLLRLDVKGIEINSLMIEVTNEVNWINIWLRAKAQMHFRDFSSAISLFKSLDSNGILKDNVSLLINMAYCYHYMCNETAALLTFERAIKIDPFLKTGRDLLANLLATSNDKKLLKELERILPSETDTSLWSYVDWTVMGYYMFAQKKFDKAIYLAEQSCKMERSVDGLLLRARIYTQLNKYYDASPDLREALLICPYRFDLHKELVQIYLLTNRVRESVTVANNACKQLNNSLPSLTLYASVLMKDPMNTTKTKGILEKVIKSDPPYLPAVYLYVEILIKEDSFDEAIKLMKKLVDISPSSKLHQLLGDCYVGLQKGEEAFHHYDIALRIDPFNRKAVDGIENIGRLFASNKLESTCYSHAGDSSNTYPSQSSTAVDHDGEPDSDTDNWPNNNMMSFSV